MLRALGMLFAAGSVVACAVAVGVGYIIWDVSRTLPDYTQLAQYEPPVMSRVHAADGSLLAEYAKERRLFVPINTVPKKLVEAFISAEDKNFYQHTGLDYSALARAALQDVFTLVRGGNRRLIGASTITQQVAKNFLLSSDRTIQRKLKEALLARRIEWTFSKDQILQLYLNEIFLGAGSYGVAAAALNYFGKSLTELDTAQCAFLAALPKAPNNYNPIRHHKRAVERRDWVLDRMLENGYISQAEHDAAVAEPLKAKMRAFGAQLFAAESFTEEVRREVTQIYGDKELYSGGLSIRTTLDPKLQLLARKALTTGLIKFDRTKGWRGPVKHIDASDDWSALLRAIKIPDDLQPWRLAVVLEAGDESATIGLRPKRRPGSKTEPARETGTVPLALMQWARKALRGDKLGPKVEKVSDILNPGDVVYVAPSRNEGEYHLVQIPEIEGALIAMDPNTGRVLAMTGGFSYGVSQFNRAIQAQRQPGSAIKPFVYAAALDDNYTPASVVLDAPLEIKLKNGDIWKPKNYSNKFYGPSTLRRGIELSRNVMTVRLASDMGIDKVAAMSEKLGIYDHMPHMLAMALGAGETSLIKMAAGYSMIANGGRKIDVSLIDRIQDRYGKTIYRHDKRECIGCNAKDWHNQPEPEFIDNRPQVMNTYTAYQITSMLEGVVQEGTGKALQIVGKPVAGKTGTTSEERDAWFIGFAPNLCVGVYIGYDTPRAMGRLATGGHLAAPIVADFMQPALAGKPATPFRVPPGIQLIPIDSASGQRVAYGAKDMILEAFKPGGEPPSDTVVIGTGQIPVDSDAAVFEGGLTTGTGGLY